MFYGKAGYSGESRGGRNDRYDQMTKQQKLIEEKKREIEAKREIERQKRILEAKAKIQGSVEDASRAKEAGSSAGRSIPSSSNLQSDDEAQETSSAASIVNAFVNDGSFFEQFKKMQEEQERKKKEDEEKKKGKAFIKLELEGGKPVFAANSFKVLNSEKTEGGNEYGSESDYQNERLARNFYTQVPPPPPPPPPDAKEPSIKREYVEEPDNSESFSENYRSPPPLGLSLSFQESFPPQNPPQYTGFPSPNVKSLAARVASEGDHVEDQARMNSQSDPLLWFLRKPDSAEYRTFRGLVEQLKKQQQIHASTACNVKVEPNQNLAQPEYGFRRSDDFVESYGIKRSPEESEQEMRERKRRSRWGPQSAVPPPISQIAPPLPGKFAPNHEIGMAPIDNELPSSSAKKAGVMVSKVGRADPNLLAYARQAYGTVELDDDQWKQCEEAYKMKLVFQDIQKKKEVDRQLEAAGKFKHEYDSDEDVDDGTWEHRQRMKEMEKTKEWAEKLTSMGKGKHHIGDFLPPDELEKFMEKYKAVKEGREAITKSEYEKYKIQNDNIGFKMLQKMGWSDGEGLGATSQGITAPIEKSNTGTDKQGLGIEKPSDLSEQDDEYAAYRKRMMLAYRFRPNPLNNPRRAYY